MGVNMGWILYFHRHKSPEDCGKKSNEVTIGGIDRSLK